MCSISPSCPGWTGCAATRSSAAMWSTTLPPALRPRVPEGRGGGWGGWDDRTTWGRRVSTFRSHPEPEAPTSEDPRKGSPGHRQRRRALASSATRDKVTDRPCSLTGCEAERRRGSEPPGAHWALGQRGRWLLPTMARGAVVQAGAPGACVQEKTPHPTAPHLLCWLKSSRTPWDELGLGRGRAPSRGSAAPPPARLVAGEARGVPVPSGEAAALQGGNLPGLLPAVPPSYNEEFMVQAPPLTKLVGLQ